MDLFEDADVRLDVYARVALEELCVRAAGRPDALRMGRRLRLLRSV